MISKNDVLRIARLARLTLREDEIEDCRREMSQIIDYFNEISEINTEGVSSLITPTEIEPHLREDRIQTEGSMERDKNLGHTEERVGNLFRVPPFI